MIPIDPEDYRAWKSRLEGAERLIDKLKPLWRDNVSAFEGKPLDGEPKTDTVIVNKDYSRVKQKQAQLFFQVPELQAKARRPEFEDAAPLHQSVVNFYLSKRMDAEKMVDEVLTDVLCASGIGVSKIGYQACVDGTRQVPAVDPATVDPRLVMAGALPMVDVPRIVHEEYYWKRISPAKLRLPADFGGTNFDDAPWIGFEFRTSIAEAKKYYGLPDGFEPKGGRDENVLSPRDAEHASSPATDLCGWEIWYKASLFDKSVKHPLKMRRLVIIEGLDQPAVHEDSPYQKFDEASGKFLVGLKRFPVRVLTLTTVPDKAIPPSDSTITRPQVNELWKGRSQMIAQRDRSLPIRWFDVNQVDDETAEKLERGELQGFLKLQQSGERAVGEIARANYPRENFEFDRVINHDLDEAWSMGANQVGVETSGETTAEEVRTIQTNANTRLDYDRAKVLRWFLEGAEMVGALLQMFADDEDYVEVIGQDGVRRLHAWDKTKIAGEFVFDAMPDSALRIDAAKERSQALNLYQLLANEPWINRQKLVESVLRKHNLDPAPIMAQQPPQKQPDSPAIAYRFGGDELNPLNPAFPIVLEILAQAGMQISPEAVKQSQQMSLNLQMAQIAGLNTTPPVNTKHGGAAQQAEPLSKHQLDGKGAR